MAYRRLSFLSARVWYAKLWERTEDYYFAPPPKQPDAITATYLNVYLKSTFTVHALRILNLDYELDEDSVARLTRDIRTHAIAAGRRVGVRFTPGNSTYFNTMEGELSLEWLERVAEETAEYAVEIWNPEEAERRHDEAVRRGKGSHLSLTPEDLIPLQGKSISIQAQALGCSPRKISYLRAELRASS